MTAKLSPFLRIRGAADAFLRRLPLLFLVTVAVVSVFGDLLAPSGSGDQFREYPSAPPSRQFPLGTDELGRDRLSRLIHGSRVSLALAPSAAAAASLIAVLFALAAGWGSRRGEAIILALTDAFAAIPSLLLLFIARALLPLNVSASISLGLTFALLALVGWTGGVRVFSATIKDVQNSPFLLQARVSGLPARQIALSHILSAIAPVWKAQFCTLIPVYLLAEANLGMLGLGVAEPLPSWGNLLMELTSTPAIQQQPWILAPAALLVTVVLSLHSVLGKEKAS